MEKRLRLLAEFLKDADSYVDSYHDGALESAVKYAQQETMQRIGQYLEEILDYSEEDVEKQLNYDPRREKYEI